MLSNQELNNEIHNLCTKLVKIPSAREHFDNYLINNKDKETM